MLLRPLQLALLAALAFGVMGCRCKDPVDQLPPAQLLVTPDRLSLPPTYLGHSTSAQLTLSHGGGAVAELELLIGAPFALDRDRLTLVKGETVALNVTFSPTQPGPAIALFRVGALEIPVDGVGLEIPACLPDSTCTDARFDAALGQCLQSPKPQGVACESSCLTMASCDQGVCRGTLKDCTDQNECTVDACGDDGGCVRTPRSCPAALSGCQVSECDPLTGCGFSNQPDGTLCGRDDCLDNTISVCITGQCVQRPRPATGRCANRWLPMTPPDRYAHAMTYDSTRGVVLVLGGLIEGVKGLSDLWEISPGTPRLRVPAVSPSARWFSSMAYDERRQRAVFFGGENFSGLHSDTWEWDGTNWVLRAPALSPPPRRDHAMSYDAARDRVVLFGGLGLTANVLNDTWEWDGVRWVQAAPPMMPSARHFHALAYDPARQRTILFGGSANPSGGDLLGDTWEWNGSTWTQALAAQSPVARAHHAMAHDSARGRTVVVGGSGNSVTRLDDTWEWDGTTWAQAAPLPVKRGYHCMVYDSRRQRVVLYGGLDERYQSGSGTWEWDGTSWTQPPFAARPERRSSSAFAYDTTRQQALLYGGLPLPPPGLTLPYARDTWAWNGVALSLLTPATSPDQNTFGPMSFDRARGRGVMWAGKVWEWDGATWGQVPVAAPAPTGHVIAYDVARQRVVLFGGQPVASTWEWDGVTWSLRSTPSSPPARRQSSMAYDSRRSRLVLFGGIDNAGRLNDTWELDAVDWSRRAVTSLAPSRRSDAAMAFDEVRGVTVLWGGWSSQSNLNDTWEWDGQSWTPRTLVSEPSPTFYPSMVYDVARDRITLFDGADVWVFLP